MTQRVIDINPIARVESNQLFITYKNISEISFIVFDLADTVESLEVLILKQDINKIKVLLNSID